MLVLKGSTANFKVQYDDQLLLTASMDLRSPTPSSRAAKPTSQR